MVKIRAHSHPAIAFAFAFAMELAIRWVPLLAMILFRPSDATHDATYFKATCKASMDSVAIFCNASCGILMGLFNFSWFIYMFYYL